MRTMRCFADALEVFRVEGWVLEHVGEEVKRAPPELLVRTVTLELAESMPALTPTEVPSFSASSAI